MTGTNVSTCHGLINYDCGSSINTFDENKFLKFCIEDKTNNLQGSHWAPHLIHRDLWDKIGGFSEEFNPGDGSDPDFCMKLWRQNVRIFKTISKFKVYHFSSVTTRKSRIKLNNGTEILANPISVKAKGDKTTVSLRPERALINPKDKMDNNHKGKIKEVIYHGDHTRLRMDILGNEQFILKIPNSSSNLDIKLGNEINVGWNAIDSRALDPK